MVDFDYLRRGFRWLSVKKYDEAADTIGKATVIRASPDNYKTV
jgi:hypothetical protein